VSEALDPRDALLRRLLLEEADPLAAFARSELAGDASARAELEELLDAERRVGAIAAAERAALRPSAPGSPERAAEERLLERLRSHLAEQAPVRKSPQVPAAAPAQSKAPPARTRPFGPKLAWLLAATLALILGWRWIAGRETEPDPDTKLGNSEDLVIDTPVTSYGEITWKGKLEADGYFVVRVLDGTPGVTDDKVASSPPLVENRWVPAEDEWTRWPDEIRIFVESWGPGPNELVGRSLEVRARHSH
jgi:hypothetical protein